jgi:hypothetical protein
MIITYNRPAYSIIRWSNLSDQRRLCRWFSPELLINPVQQLTIGGILMVIGFSTYLSEKVRKYSATLAYAGFAVLNSRFLPYLHQIIESAILNEPRTTNSDRAQHRSQYLQYVTER